MTKPNEEGVDNKGFTDAAEVSSLEKVVPVNNGELILSVCLKNM